MADHQQWEQLRNRVKAALMAQTDSAGVDVDVDAQGGAVRLHGIVDTLSQRQAAESIARQVPGVERVVNDITVGFEKGWDRGDIEGAINQRLAESPRTDGIGAAVEEGGRIRLVGHAATPGDVDLARRAAARVPGTTEVYSQVKIGEGGGADDAVVARRALAALEQLGYGTDQLTLWADAGTLHVRGLVGSRQEAKEIEKALRRIPGVVGVEALLPADPEAGREPEDHKLH